MTSRNQETSKKIKTNIKEKTGFLSKTINNLSFLRVFHHPKDILRRSSANLPLCHPWGGAVGDSAVLEPTSLRDSMGINSLPFAPSPRKIAINKRYKLVFEPSPNGWFMDVYGIVLPT